MTRVKICGITTIEDAITAAEAGADMLGFNFYRQSPRYVEPALAAEIADALRTQIGSSAPILIGLFVNEPVGKVSVTMEQVGIRFAQLSGDESAEMLRELHGTAFKSIRPRDMQQALGDVDYFRPFFPEDERIPSILVDAYHPGLYGGTGEAASTEVALAIRTHVPRLMLAGGLTPENVALRIAAVQPWAVDVASGVEDKGTPGKKNHDKIRAFIQSAKRHVAQEN